MNDEFERLLQTLFAARVKFVLVGGLAAVAHGAATLTGAVAEEIEVYGLPCFVLTLEGLIRAKRAAGRPKDLHALYELEALLALKQKGEGE